MSIESVRPSNHLILCHPLLLLPSIFPSIGVFFNESALRIRWPKYWSFSFSPSNDYSGLISFSMDWFDLLVVQGILKSLLQNHSSALSFLYSPTLTSIHDHWENHSFDQMDLCWQNKGASPGGSSALNTPCLHVNILAFFLSNSYCFSLGWEGRAWFKTVEI